MKKINIFIFLRYSCLVFPSGQFTLSKWSSWFLNLIFYFIGKLIHFSGNWRKIFFQILKFQLFKQKIKNLLKLLDTTSPTMEKLRDTMGRALKDGIVNNRTFRSIAENTHDQHVEPFVQKYEWELERQKSTKSYISIEERVQWRARLWRNCRGKNSRKIHKKNQKLAKIQNRIERINNDMQHLQDQIEQNKSTAETIAEPTAASREKFPQTYDLPIFRWWRLDHILKCLL